MDHAQDADLVRFNLIEDEVVAEGIRLVPAKPSIIGYRSLASARLLQASRSSVTKRDACLGFSLPM
jgi:hypothetical protein